MAQLSYFDKTGKSVGVLEVDEKIFGERVRTKLLHQMVIAYEANRRSGTRSGLRKGEVEGSSRKPWPQKHTGRARAGMIRSPIWRKGGMPHAVKPQDWTHRMPKSMTRPALDSAFLGKILDKELHVIEALPFEKPKTKEASKLLRDTMGFGKSLLIGTEAHNKNAYLSVRNMPKVSLKNVTDFNAYELLRHKDILLTRAALEKIVKARQGEVKGPTSKR